MTSSGRSALAAVVLLVAVATAARPAAGEAVVAPSVFRLGYPATVLVLGADGSNYQARLEQADCETNCEAPLVVTGGSPIGGAVELVVEVPMGRTPGRHLLTVTQGGAVLQEQEVELAADGGPMLLLETDKPVYKPGAEVKARVLCLLPNFQPCTDLTAVRLVLKNPDGNKVFALAGNGSASAGVFEGSLLIDSRAPLGTYAVVAEAGELGAELSVSVDEYVLPKFEVELEVEQEYLSPATKELTGTVRAVYSYGEGVAGAATFTLRKQSYGWECQPRGAPEMPVAEEDARQAPGGFAGSMPPLPGGDCDTVLATVPAAQLEDGEYAFTIPRPSGLDTWGTLNLDVSITEEATGSVVNASTSVQLRGEVYPSVQLDVPEVWYPGLDIPVEITSEFSDGKPNDGAVTVEVEFRPYGWEASGVEPQTVRREVQVVGGKASVRIPAPPQPACCMEAVADLASFQWGKDTCCWGTVNPRAFMAEVEGQRGVEGYGSCMEPAFPPSAEYLTIESAESDGTDPASVRVAVTATGNLSQRDVFYLVTVDGSYVTSGAVAWDVPPSAASSGMSGGEFLLTKSLAMVPTAHLVVAYVGASGKLTAGEKTVALDAPAELGMLASRPVTLSVGAATVEPGDEVRVDVAAEPESVVFLGAVDRSVRFLSDEDTRVSPARLMAALKGQAYEPPAPPVPSPCAAVRAVAAAGMFVGVPESHPDHDFCFGLDERRVAQYNSGPTCRYYYGGGDMMFDDMLAVPVMEMADGGIAENERAVPPAAAAGQGAAARQAPRVRTSFPETWIWRSAVVAPNGSASLLAAAPDSITTWELSAFSVSPTAGLGLDFGTGAEVRVFKPLFVQIKLPYKVVRGEGLVVVLSVFNYLDTPQSVTLSLSSPTGAPIPAGAASRQLEVGANAAASYETTITFSELGTARLQLSGASSDGAADAVEGSVKVVPEGHRQQRTVNLMLQPEEEAGGVQVAELSVRVEDEAAVEDSGYASLTLSGDLMGPSLEGLDSLVQLPMGCGEQNMLLMAPNVYVMRYLNAKNDLRPALSDAARRNIQVGYSRELEYRHDDGSFSAFGKSDDSGSTWLTAFVLKVFAQAQSAGLVEVAGDGVAWDAARWLADLQDETGRFASVGRVIHSEMVGGVDDDADSLSLTAFVVDALLEARAAGLLPSDFPPGAIGASLALVADRLDRADVTNYSVVVTAHALARAASQGFTSSELDVAAAAQAAADRLDAIAIEEDGSKHWAPAASSGTIAPAADAMRCRGCHTAAAAGPEIEMTGYALSTLLLLGGDSSAALADAFPVVRWLLAERSPSGGWRSTQDTTVALEGLASYASRVSATPPAMSVTVSYTDGVSRRRLRQAREVDLTLDASNSDVLQRLELPVGTDVTITARGTGMAVLGVSTVWNTKATPAIEVFRVSGKVMEREAGNPSAVTQEMTVARNPGTAGTGMVIAKVTALTGYVPTAESLELMKGGCGGAVKRVDNENDEVSVYLDKLEAGAEPCTLRFDMTRDSVVENLAPAPVEAYAYYNPEEERGVGEVSAEMQVYVEAPSPPAPGSPTPTPTPTSGAVPASVRSLAAAIAAAALALVLA